MKLQYYVCKSVSSGEGYRTIMVLLLNFVYYFYIVLPISLLNAPPRDGYEGPAKSFVTGFGLLQCYVLANIFLTQTFKVFPLY